MPRNWYSHNFCKTRVFCTSFLVLIDLSRMLLSKESIRFVKHSQSTLLSVQSTHFYVGESVNTTTFLLNRIPSPLLKHKSPYEVLFNKPPACHSLRTFGCLCYASTIPTLKHKFRLKAIPSIFVGYPIGYKGYKLYNL